MQQLLSVHLFFLHWASGQNRDQVVLLHIQNLPPPPRYNSIAINTVVAFSIISSLFIGDQVKTQIKFVVLFNVFFTRYSCTLFSQYQFSITLYVYFFIHSSEQYILKNHIHFQVFIRFICVNFHCLHSHMIYCLYVSYFCTFCCPFSVLCKSIYFTDTYLLCFYLIRSIYVYFIFSLSCSS